MARLAQEGMRVLHLPTNIASQASVTVRALAEIGVEARGLVANNQGIKSSIGLDNYVLLSRTRHPFRGCWGALAWWRAVLWGIGWADVIHHHYHAPALPYGIDLKWAAALGKARIVEFWGSDIRVSSLAASDNPYFAEYHRKHPNVSGSAGSVSHQIQRRFARYGYACLVPGVELESYVQAKLFPKTWITRQRIMLEDYQPCFPDPGNLRPLIVHCPSKVEVKGTEAVLRVVAQLRASHDLDFKLIHGAARPAALAEIRRCDVFLDQFVLGDHGLAALEAMALGKPTVCYIKPSLLPKHPPDLPVVNATQDSLAAVLQGLLEDGRCRKEIGRRSRAYVEKYHDARKLARELTGIYQEIWRDPHPYGHRERRAAH